MTGQGLVDDLLVGRHRIDRCFELVQATRIGEPHGRTPVPGSRFAQLFVQRRTDPQCRRFVALVDDDALDAVADPGNAKVDGPAGAGGVQRGQSLVELTGLEQAERRAEQLRREQS